MKTIWKYHIELKNVGDISYVEMPKGAEPLSAGSQEYGNFVVWAAVDPDAETIPHGFAIHGTGHNVQDETAGSRFLNTIFMDALVFHVFDLGEVPQ